MKLVLLSGGTGTRLWPLSHPSCPKQYIQLFQDDHGNPESILQRNIRLLRSLEMSEHTWISSVSSQQELLREQLPDEIPIVLEPEGRDTIPAIALVCSYLYTVRNNVCHRMRLSFFVQRIFMSMKHYLKRYRICSLFVLATT